MHPDKPENIKQLQLPSGKVIEVVYFSNAGHETGAKVPPGTATEGSELTPSAAPVRDSEELHVCPRCSGDLVYPVDWAEAGPVHWEVSLRCPECEWANRGVFSQAMVERFDVELDRGAEVLVRDLQHLAHANMADDIERFVGALRDDHIVPSDF
jgi:hypothetical protein